MNSFKKLTSYKSFTVPLDYAEGTMDAFEAIEYLNKLGMNREADRLYTTLKNIKVEAGYQVTSPGRNVYKPGMMLPITSQDIPDWSTFEGKVQSGELQNWLIEQSTDEADDTTEEESVSTYSKEVYTHVQELVKEGNIQEAIEQVDEYLESLKRVEGTQTHQEQMERILDGLQKLSTEEVKSESGMPLKDLETLDEFLEKYSEARATNEIRGLRGHDSSRFSIIFNRKFNKKDEEYTFDIRHLFAALSLVGQPESAEVLSDLLLGKKGKQTIAFHKVFPFLEKMSNSEVNAFLKDMFTILQQKPSGRNQHAQHIAVVSSLVQLIRSKLTQEDSKTLDPSRFFEIVEADLTNLGEAADKSTAIRQKEKLDLLRDMKSYSNQIELFNNGFVVAAILSELGGRELAIDLVKKHFHILPNPGFKHIDRETLLNLELEELFKAISLSPKDTSLDGARSYYRDIENTLNGVNFAKAGAVYDLLRKKHTGMPIIDLFGIDDKKKNQEIHGKLATRVYEELSPLGDSSPEEMKAAIGRAIDSVAKEYGLEKAVEDNKVRVVEVLQKGLENSIEWKQAEYNITKRSEIARRSVFSYMVAMFRSFSIKSDSPENYHIQRFHHLVKYILDVPGLDVRNGVFRDLNNRELIVSMGLANSMRAIPLNLESGKIEWDEGQLDALLLGAGYDNTPENKKDLMNNEKRITSDVLYSYLESGLSTGWSTGLRNAFRGSFGYVRNKDGSFMNSPDEIKDTKMVVEDSHPKHLSNQAVKQIAIDIFGEGPNNLITRLKEVAFFENNEEIKASITEEIKAKVREAVKNSDNKDLIEQYAANMVNEVHEKIARLRASGKKDNIGHAGYHLEGVTQLPFIIAIANNEEMKNLRILDKDNTFEGGKLNVDAKGVKSVPDGVNPINGLQGLAWTDSKGDTHLFGSPVWQNGDAVDYSRITLHSSGDITLSPLEAKMEKEDGEVAPHQNSLDAYMRLGASAYKYHKEQGHEKIGTVRFREMQVINATHVTGKVGVAHAKTHTEINKTDSKSLGKNGGIGKGVLIT